MKMFIPMLFGLLLISGTAFAASNLAITSPVDGSTINSSTMITATTTADAICQYKIDSGPFVVMGTTGGMSHSQTMPSLSGGSHTVHIQCNIPNSNEIVTFSVPPSVPEFPAPIIPVLLSIASFGMIARMR